MNELKEYDKLLKEYFDNGLDFIIISPHIKNHKDKKLKEKEWHKAFLRYFYILISNL